MLWDILKTNSFSGIMLLGRGLISSCGILGHGTLHVPSKIVVTPLSPEQSFNLRRNVLSSLLIVSKIYIAIFLDFISLLICSYF